MGNNTNHYPTIHSIRPMPFPSPRWPNKSILGWLLYDIASSGYALLIPSVAFAVYYRQAVCGGEAHCDLQWAMVTSLSLVFAGVLSPLLGAIADLGQLRDRIFVITTLLCCAATATLFWVEPGAMVFGGLAFFLAQAGYILSMGLYDSYLPSLVPARRMGQLSGLGWGLGYLGGLVCFFIAYGWMQGGLVAENLPTYRLTFLVVAGFYAVMAVPAMAWLPRQTAPSSNRQRTLPLIHQSYNRVFDTLRNWQQTPELFQFLLGYYLISDGVVTIISFTAIYMHLQFGLGMATILQLTLLFNAIAIPATIMFGMLNQRWSEKALLKVVLVLWIVTLALMVFSRHPLTPTLIACGLGLVVGSTQSICRGMFAQMVPPDQAAEKFGFHALVSKVSAICGPLLFGLISSVSGSQRWAMLSMAVFFLAGSWVLFKVPTVSPHHPQPQPRG
jgi:MFS transporter, UMF1 family